MDGPRDIILSEDRQIWQNYYSYVKFKNKIKLKKKRKKKASKKKKKKKEPLDESERG